MKKMNVTHNLKVYFPAVLFLFIHIFFVRFLKINIIL